MPSRDSSRLHAIGLLPSLPADSSLTPPATKTPQRLSPSDFPPPTTPLATRINAYVKKALPQQTYTHSLRVYTYGRAISDQCFPAWNIESNSVLDESWFVTAMLHDIGTTPDHISSSHLSYEFWAGYHALSVLQDAQSTRSYHGDEQGGVAGTDQAESVAEAIIRHQDVQDKGKISLLTRLIHLGTLLDNIGAGMELVHEETVRAVNDVYERKGWCGCFRDTVVKEKELKPWAMVSRIEGFEQAIDKNGHGAMKKWDGNA